MAGGVQTQTQLRASEEIEASGSGNLHGLLMIMTMDFNVANEIDLSDITAGMRLHIEITKTQDGAYVITTLHIQASDKGTMDHSQHEGAHE